MSNQETDSEKRGDPETDRLSGRLKRYAKVGAAVGGLAADLGAKQLFGKTLNRDRHASDLRSALGGLKGPLMKVAQLLSSVPDMLPQEYARELTELQANAPSMGWPFVKRRMTSELGPDWRDKFANFEREATAAASLGQVHYATGKDGRELACKLQYPDMESTVEADLKQLKLIFQIYRRFDSAVDTREIYEEISERLREELDYRREARHMALYGNILKNEAGAHVPIPVPELSTRRLLTMDWLHGRKLLEFKECDQEHRNRVAKNMFRAWYLPFYAYGIIHGDPHLGNYSVREDFSINLLDFGCIRVFPPDFVQSVIDLYYALRDGNEALAVSAYETWGFENLSKELIEVLNIWAKFVYAPLMEDRVRPIEETNAMAYGAEAAAKVHGELKRLGGVTPPREFLLMDRSTIGLGSVFLHLRAEINWCETFHELIDGLDVKAIGTRQEAALAAAGLPREER